MPEAGAAMDPETERRINEKPPLIVEGGTLASGRGCLFWLVLILIATAFLLSWIWPDTFGSLRENAGRLSGLLRHL